MIIKVQKFLKDVPLNFQGELYVVLLKRNRKVRPVCRRVYIYIMCVCVCVFTSYIVLYLTVINSN